MKRLLLFLFTAVSALTSSAQIAEGYYRIQSADQLRYVTLVDNRGSINISTTSADMSALKTVLGFERVVSNPGSIIYFKKIDNGYDFQAQGTGSYSIVSCPVRVTATGDGTYWAYASKSGMSKYLADQVISWMWADNDPRRITGEVTGIPAPTGTEADWNVIPVNAEDGHYFGITPTVTAGGAYYQSFYAAFPFTFTSTGMTAYAVTTVDARKAAVVLKEVTGGVPAATPVIIKCSSDQPVNNKLNIGAAATGSAAGNLLNGVYFCNDVEDPGHRNVKAYDPATMRVLGTAADGSLAFVKSETLKYIPANTAYIMVPADAPAELKAYSQAEYDALPEPQEGPTPVNIAVNSFSRKYGEANPEFTYTVSPQDLDLTGLLTVVCEANEQSGVGDYPITVVCSSDDYDVSCVPGTLTVTPVELTVAAQNVQRLYGAENPALSYTVQGFVNNETEAVLTEKPVVATEATKTSPAGAYTITVSGGQAANYTISKYIGATLTVSKAPLKVIAGSASRVYGAANPDISYVVMGFVNGETESVLTAKPTVTVSATPASGVGSYAVKVAGAAAANYDISYYDGTLTVTKATLTATANDVEWMMGSEWPTFSVTYSGFVNGESESVLTKKPVASTTATKDSTEGTYTITVSGGEAANYAFNYVSGKLTIKANPDGISSLEAVRGTFDVYNMRGQKIRSGVSSLEDLPKGLYIINGQKVVR